MMHSLHEKKGGSVLLAGLLWMSFFITSCDVQPSTLGKDLLPADDVPFFGYDLNSTLHQFTLSQDSLQSGFGIPRPFGEFEDPVFGKINASLLTELICPEVPLLKAMAKADSMVFWLQPDSISGDAYQQMMVEIFEMNLPLDTATVYQSMTRPEDYVHGDKFLGISSYIPGDSIISFKLDLKHTPVKDLASRLLSLDTTVMMDQNEFIKHFPGIYIKSSRINPSGTGSILYPKFYSMGMNLYYHYPEKPDSILQITYYGNVSAACFNFSYENALIEPYLNDSLSQNNLGFIRGMGGASLICDLTDTSRWLDSLKTGHSYTINKARLILKPKDLSTYGLLPSDYPGRLDIFYLDGHTESAVPMAMSSGTYHAERNEYSFSLNEYFLQYMGKKTSRTRFKIVPYYYYNPNTGEAITLRHYSNKRVVLDLSRSELSLFYTKIP